MSCLVILDRLVFSNLPQLFLENMDALVREFSADPSEVRFGVAPHSIRAVSLGELKEIAAWCRERRLPLHMHVAERLQKTLLVCEYGATPVALLHREGILGPDLTAVHAIHVREDEIAMLAETASTICSCPTTERNLGDGILAADKVMAARIPIALDRTARRRSILSKMRASWTTICGSRNRSAPSWIRWAGLRWLHGSSIVRR